MTHQERNEYSMKRFIKMLAVSCVAALALAVVSAAGASAATFTASATGNLVGSATTNQVFTVGGANVVTCKKAHTTGEIKSVAATEQEVTVTYSECSATFFGFPAGTVDISPATYNFKANGEVETLNAVSIKATGLGCETIVSSGQTLGTNTYTTKNVEVEKGVFVEKIETHANVTGIKSTSPNGCPSGTSGTYKGSNVTERVGGGNISFDA
jgi:hypothetical protein